jgi:hypothetical protein
MATSAGLPSCNSAAVTNSRGPVSLNMYSSSARRNSGGTGAMRTPAWMLPVSRDSSA